MLDIILRQINSLETQLRYPRVQKYFQEIYLEERSSPEAWRKFNLKRLRAILIHAGKNVPYYARLFQERGFDPEKAELPTELNRIPVLTKKQLHENGRELLDPNIPPKWRVENATGGSTGQPVVFWQGSDYREIASAIENNLLTWWWEINPYGKKAAVWGADREFHEQSFREKLYSWRRQIRTLNAFRMDQSDLLAFCKMLVQWKPPYLIGYASALYRFACFAEQNGFDSLRFHALRSSAEMLYPEYREKIEQVFRSPLYNFYGSREINNLAAECKNHEGLHLLSTWRYVEMTDADGNAVAPGTPGYVTVTDCGNRIMPFIRYQNGDIGVLSATPCSCGRPNPVLKEILGRSVDMIIAQDGTMVHGEYFTHLFYGRDDIKAFQIHQTAIDRIVVRYVPLAESAHAFVESEWFREKIEKMLGPSVTLEFQPCDMIPIPPSGKHRYTISEVKREKELPVELH